LPDGLLKQVKIGGRILAAVGEEPVMTTQIVTRVSETTFETARLFETNIKPLRHATAPSHFKF
jgi:protein-L-isoaspartate(D-aspartate) O-methyltransferase